MGDIIPFIARVRDSGDWTAPERARLETLVNQFAEAGLKVEVVYGVTEDGDPWCVVKDANEEVLLHVARIGGVFVVHQAADDSLAEATDLPAALGQHLMLLDDPRGDVVPFEAGGRQLQTLIALLVVTAFFYDTRDAPPVIALDVSLDLTATPVADVPAAPALDADPRQAHDLAAHWTALPDAAPPAAAPTIQLAANDAPIVSSAGSAATALPERTADTAPATARAAAAAPRFEVASTDPQPSAPHLIVGTEHNDVLVGTAQADLIRGGAGDDTLSGGGAAPGQFDTLDGGAGNDRIEVTGQVVAIGGTGADTFVIETPKTSDHPDTLLGVIVDFHPGEGDRLVNHHGDPVTFVAAPQGFAFRQHPPELPAGVVPSNVSVSAVFVDLNGDGRPDGFLLMGHGQPPSGDGSVAPAPETGATHDHEVDPAILSVGLSAPHPSFMG